MDEPYESVHSSTKSTKNMDEPGKYADSSTKTAKNMDEPQIYGSKWGIGFSLNRFSACLRSMSALVAGSSQTPVRI